METLRYNSTGSLVEAIQLALKRSGFYKGNLDGIFKSQTQDAVINFQKSKGLTADGIVGKDTYSALSPYLRGYAIYTICKGDTLYSIARRHSTTVNAITAANPEVNPQNLKIGSQIYVPFIFPLTPTNISYSYMLNAYVIDGLRARYPFLNIFSIGQSELGKELLTVKIGNGQKTLYYNAAFHANEWITTPVLLKFIEDYAAAIVSDGNIFGVKAMSLSAEYTLYLTPMVNPDGVDLVTGAISHGEIYDNAVKIANDYPSIPFPDGWNANINGIDLNLQFPALWEKAKETKYNEGFISPAPKEFPGNTPLSEPESRAVFDFTKRNDFLLTLSYHTQGELIYWKFDDFFPPLSYEIATRLSSVSGYSLDLTPENSDFAGYKDWFIKEYNRPSYTVEAGKGQNPLPITQFDKIYKENLGLLVTALTSV